MDEIIYAANPLQVFGVQLAISAFVLGLGIISVPMAFRQKHTFPIRGVILAFSGIVIAAGLILLGAIGYAYTNGTKTMTAKLTGKNVVYNNSSDSNSPPVPVYRIDLGATNTFDIPDEAAYKRLTIGECLSVIYYPSFSLGLFSNQSQSGERYPGSVGEISRAAGCK